MQINYSSEVPETIQYFDKDHITINFDIVKVKEAEGDLPAIYEYKSVLIPQEESKRLEALVVAFIREQYSENQEYEALRERDSEPEKFTAYNSFVQSCQAKAKEILR